MKRLSIPLLCFLYFSGCSSAEETERKILRKHNQEIAPILRREQDRSLPLPKIPKRAVPSYDWNLPQKRHFITKEYFRCKGSAKHPPYENDQGGKLERIYDCKGSDHHSLPLREEKEFIYPILIELLNELQEKTHSDVIITSGHRCPEHNKYVDPTIYNQSSKHLMGAEVSFYVKGWESRPEKIVELLKNHYQTVSYSENYRDFKRYEKPDTNVSTPPWYNKEIFIKLFLKDEGRNLDNKHSFPYISIQVRYDRELKKRVSYSWDLAYKNYYRW